jgi:hypothetical protein
VKSLSPEAQEGLALVRAYLRDEMTYATLWERYDAFFKTYDGSDDEVRLLDGIWGALEVTTPDRTLIDDFPGHYLDEDELQIVLARKLAPVDAA